MGDPNRHAEFHPTCERREKILLDRVLKLETALKRVRDEFDFAWDQGDPEPLRQIAIEALKN